MAYRQNSFVNEMDKGTVLTCVSVYFPLPGVHVYEQMPALEEGLLRDSLFHVPCDMEKCLVVGRPALHEDVRLGHVSLVKCEGNEGTCCRLLHSVCTLTEHMYRHAFCCRHVLHDTSGKARLHLCDACAQSMICDRPYAFGSNGRGRW